jgi:hypothetical protein
LEVNCAESSLRRVGYTRAVDSLITFEVFGNIVEVVTISAGIRIAIVVGTRPTSRIVLLGADFIVYILRKITNGVEYSWSPFAE